ncbi:hypothetical protein OG390_40940 [Streptomyces sp. NBC_00996]|nr:hypothetical protein OG390_40940 [Streptomyces sp. NBC_00996]
MAPPAPDHLLGVRPVRDRRGSVAEQHGEGLRGASAAGGDEARQHAGVETARQQHAGALAVQCPPDRVLQQLPEVLDGGVEAEFVRAGLQTPVGFLADAVRCDAQRVAGLHLTHAAQDTVPGAA